MLTKLFTPGPVGVDKTILKELFKPILFHRTSPFEKVYQEVTRKLNKVFDADESYVSLILTGSGTMANEAAISSFIGKKDKVLIISNGQFGERLATILKLHGIKFRFCDFGWANEVDTKQVIKDVKKFKPRWVLSVLLETSTGMVNPIHEIGEICHKYKVRFMVDAVSGLVAEKLSVMGDNIDVCISVANKALEAPPGLSFVCVRKDILIKSAQLKQHSYYLNLCRYYDSFLKNQTPTTPAVSLFVAVNKALDVLSKESILGRQRRYLKHSALVRKSLMNKNVSLLTAIYKLPSRAITTILLNDHESALDFQKYLETHGNTVWHHTYHTKDERFDRILQISVMGNIKNEDVSSLVSLISRYFKK